MAALPVEPEVATASHSTPPDPRTTLTSRRVATRRSILDAAERLLLEIEYPELSPADVSAAVGIGRTTFYEYFTDMEDLLAAMVEERLPEVTEVILAAIPRHLDHRAQLSELALRTVEFSVTDPVVGLQLHRGLAGLSASTQRRIGAAHRTLAGEFGRIYQAGVTAGEFRAMPADLVATLVGDAILGAARTLMAVHDPKTRLHEVGDELVRFLFNGLGPVPTTSSG